MLDPSEAVLSPPAPRCVNPDSVELSVVIPCLNEAETIGVCVRKAFEAMRSHGIHGEVVVADNGSTDASAEIARGLGARVVYVARRGYGSALMGGIAAARGQYVVMGDADDSYDFGDIPRFLAPLREGFDLVQGCRLPRGGGRIAPGAMPTLHRWLGNPLFSLLVRWMFGAAVNDVYCGLRGFSKRLYKELDLRCTGMEFATEMIIKASLFGKRLTETPITLHRDGRKNNAPHLRTFRDGWRTLCFFLMCCPRWLFTAPGLLLLLAGGLGYMLALPGVTVFGATLDVHTLLFASLAILLGLQCLQFGVFTKRFAIAEGVLPEDPRFSALLKYLTLERGLLVGAACLGSGMVLLLAAIAQWGAVDFGRLDYAWTMRFVIPGVTLVAAGCQTTFSSFFLNILGMARR